MKLLFDTNIISYWHSGEPRHKIPLTNFIRQIQKKNKHNSLFMSVITVQELACWLKPSGKWDSAKQWMRGKFAPPLTFCELCANKAAEMQIRGGPQAKATEAGKAEWHHDVAIVATASHHGLDTIVTSDRNLYRRYSPLFSEIVLIEAAGS